ncbi:oxygen-independent coproporphyrinogen III oxidase [Roseateles aquatilis]|uniref:Coproporphyrinogen-III oxidase n=1 Tax=Roseateles aquatilis TaxID=431061 RepID=A0A246J8H2_9BURK|nr:oxygen-independent coproporphyrinogen III oxidase [Roseateles aquatilis]MBY0365379.1 oxygen-independent coproporphyrinogen III oxidase [Burkholderiaceae bacterium]OWQ88927.1 oxygen-independent coproporphyrinogen III oxidase [Roseateles aquatilis]
MPTALIPASDIRALLTEEFLRKFDTPGPRYTSYPTADRFGETFGPGDTLQVLSDLRARSPSAPLSLYIHIPFCEQLCYYCGCNKIITKHHERAVQYLDMLEAELALVVRSLGVGRPVSQLHFGGGSPTFLSDDELARVMAALGAAFRLTPTSEISIEVDPRTVTPQRLAHFRSLGFNRLSFGVQDFDPEVQKAVHREQSFDMVRGLMLSARELGYESINADLIYGLPRQTPESFARTIEQISELRPDRIALYAYAHLPERFKPQRRIHEADLPVPAHRIAMLGGAVEGFLARGYDYIGMDHFALPQDSLAIAKREGRLHRNFQGYSTQHDCDLVALGVSAIGRVGSAYYQNAKTLPEYYESIQRGQLPVVRGYALNPDDELRRSVIMALMCQGRLEFDEVERQFSVVVDAYFAKELAALRAMADAGLVELEARAVQVTVVGWFLVRAVAMVFDRHLQAAQDRRRFSKIV